MAEVLIAVISYNNFHHTMNTVNALVQQTASVDIVLWDNCSPDGSGKKLARIYRDIPNVRVHLSPKNILWSPAINQVFQRYIVNHKYLGFMNNDIILPPESIGRMLVTLQRPKVGLVGPMAARIGGPQDWAANLGEWHFTERQIINLPPKRVTYVIGACALLPLRAWYEVGPLDEEMPLGADDHDYSIRVKRAGYEIWVNQNVYANHIGHASGGAPEWDIYNQQGWNVFNKKWAAYYKTTDEARLCHWDGKYSPGWDNGTGWLSEQEAESVNSKRVYPIDFKKESNA